MQLTGIGIGQSAVQLLGYAGLYICVCMCVWLGIQNAERALHSQLSGMCTLKYTYTWSPVLARMCAPIQPRAGASVFPCAQSRLRLGRAGRRTSPSSLPLLPFPPFLPPHHPPLSSSSSLPTLLLPNRATVSPNALLSNSPGPLLRAALGSGTGEAPT